MEQQATIENTPEYTIVKNVHTEVKHSARDKRLAKIKAQVNLGTYAVSSRKVARKFAINVIG